MAFATVSANSHNLGFPPTRGLVVLPTAHSPWKVMFDHEGWSLPYKLADLLKKK